MLVDCCLKAWMTVEFGRFTEVFIPCFCRHILIAPQIAQGALLCAVVCAPQNHVLLPLQGAPRQALRTPHPQSHISHQIIIKYISRFAPSPFARTMRFGSCAESTRVVRARSPRSTGRNGLSSACSSSVARSLSSLAARYHYRRSLVASIHRSPAAVKHYAAKVAREARIKS